MHVWTFFFFSFFLCALSFRLGHAGLILVFVTEEKLLVLDSAIFLSALRRELGMAREGRGMGGVAVIHYLVMQAILHCKKIKPGSDCIARQASLWLYKMLLHWLNIAPELLLVLRFPVKKSVQQFLFAVVACSKTIVFDFLVCTLGHDQAMTFVWYCPWQWICVCMQFVDLFWLLEKNSYDHMFFQPRTCLLLYNLPVNGTIGTIWTDLI